jgi:hypothetical protein
MEAHGGGWNGSNYLGNQADMRKALLTLGFGMASHVEDTYSYKGTAV